MSALLAIGGIAVVTFAVAYFMGYAQGRREEKDAERIRSATQAHTCSCGAVVVRIKGLTSRNAGKIGLVTGTTYHQVTPYVCHPVHDAVLGDD